MKKIIVGLAALAATAGLAACGSNADTVSKNISKEAEKFKVQRRIVAINGITDKPMFMAEGKCSVEGSGLGNLRALLIICKHGPNDYRKHYVAVSDNVAVTVTQIGGVSVSEYRTKLIFRPTSIVPDLDLMVGS